MDAKFIRHYATLSLVMSIRGMNPTATFTASLCEGNPVRGKKVRCTGGVGKTENLVDAAWTRF
jgi:hypothetical protein